MWFIGVEVEQETSAPPPKKNPGTAPEFSLTCLYSTDECSSSKRIQVGFICSCSAISEIDQCAHNVSPAILNNGN